MKNGASFVDLYLLCNKLGVILICCSLMGKKTPDSLNRFRDYLYDGRCLMEDV